MEIRSVHILLTTYGTTDLVYDLLFVFHLIILVVEMMTGPNVHTHTRAGAQSHIQARLTDTECIVRTAINKRSSRNVGWKNGMGRREQPAQVFESRVRRKGSSFRIISTKRVWRFRSPILNSYRSTTNRFFFFFSLTSALSFYWQRTTSFLRPTLFLSFFLSYLSTIDVTEKFFPFLFSFSLFIQMSNKQCESFVTRQEKILILSLVWILRSGTQSPVGCNQKIKNFKNKR